MHRPGDFLAAQHFDGPLDLAPVAEMKDVAERAAAVGTRGRLKLSMRSELGDQVGRRSERLPVLDVDMIVHARSAFFPDACFRPPRLSECRIGFLNGAFTKEGWRSGGADAMGPA